MRTATIIFAAMMFGVTAAAEANESATNYVAVDGPQIGQYWKSVGKGERVQLPKSFMRSGVDGCVAVGYSIEADGKPANLVVLRSAFSEYADKQIASDLEKRVINHFGSMRYEAAPENSRRQPIYTYAYYSFAAFLSPATKASVDEHSDFVRAHCVIADFPAAVARGDLVRKSPSP